jgi:hypothetical protein
MRRLSVILFVALTVSACGSSRVTLTDGLATMRGRSMQSAIDVLGIPNGDQLIGGQRVLTWHTPQFHCRVSVQVDNQGFITDYDWQSRGLSCDVYEDRVNAWVRSWRGNPNYASRNGDWYQNGAQVDYGESEYKRTVAACNRKVNAGAYLTDAQWQARKNCIAQAGYTWVPSR